MNTVANELDRIGYKFDIVYSEDEFAECLLDYDIAWVISSTNFHGNEKKFLEAIDNFMKKKRSLMIWGDNDPYYCH